MMNDFDLYVLIFIGRYEMERRRPDGLRFTERMGYQR